MISTLYTDIATGRRVGRCGDWVVRALPGGASFDVARPPVAEWDAIPSVNAGLALDVAARVLGIPKGELFDWGRSNR